MSDIRCNIPEAILERRSIRHYTGQHISEEDLHTILRAGMSGPTCANTRDWSFLVVRNRDTLNKMADANGRPAEPLRSCDIGILILGDLKRAFSPAKEYWVIDGAIAGQNMILAAKGLGIGSVWLGTWPQMDRVENQRTLFSLPDTKNALKMAGLDWMVEQEPIYTDGEYIEGYKANIRSTDRRCTSLQTKG